MKRCTVAVMVILYRKKLTTVSVLILVFMPGRCLFAETDLDDPKEPWKTAAVGVPHDVPPPFEPLKKDGTTVTCWGRSYRLSGLFPEKITAAGQEVLAGPIVLRVRQGNKATPLYRGHANFTELRPDRIAWKGKGSQDAIRWESQGWIEYDGVVQVRFTMRSSRAIKVDYLGLDIPLNPAFDLYHANACWGKHLNGAVSSSDGVKLTEHWIPCWWIGDDYRGLSFVTETRAGWTGTNRAFQILREKGRLILRVNVWNEPVQFQGERTFVFGLQATPTKPLPLDWQGRYVGSEEIEPANIHYVYLDREKFFSYPQEERPNTIRPMVEAIHARRKRAVLYVTPSGTGPESAVHQRNAQNWMMDDGQGKPLLYDADVERRKKGLSGVCPASSYTDWMAWSLDQAMREYDIDGIYVDNAAPYPCCNTRHGCGVEDQRSYPYFANREWFKRLYTVIRKHKPQQGLVVKHNSRFLNSFALSFADIYVDGEQFRDPKIDRNAIGLENIDRTYMRIGFTGRQWGAQPCFEASLTNGRPECTDWILARTLPFGNVMLCHHSWMDASREIPVLRARQAFGLGKETVSWFTPSDPRPKWLSLSSDDLLVGGYVHPNGRALVTLSNVQAESVAVRIGIGSLQEQFGEGFVVTDALTQSPVTVHRKGSVVIVIPGDSFRVLLLERKK